MSARDRDATVDGIEAWSRVSLDWGVEEEEGVDDVGRREASLVSSAMSGSAISDRCTVT